MSRHGSAATAFSRDAHDGAAADLASFYESTSFEAVHSGILDLVPAATVDVLDIGAGSGRDAAAMARMGHRVTAVEPSAGLMREAVRRHAGLPISWVSDALPKLARLGDATFDFVLLSAVWMHVAARGRAPAMRRLAVLTRPGGLVVMSLRHGPDGRPQAGAALQLSDVLPVARIAGLVAERVLDKPDALGRPKVSWSVLALRRPIG